MDSDPNNAEGNEGRGDNPETPGQASHQPNDGNRVPWQRAQEMANKAAANVRSELQAKIDKLESELKQRQADPPKRQYTRAELQKAVDEGTINEATRDQILFDQEREKLATELKQEVRSEFETERKSSGVRSQIQQYAAAIPSLMDETSDERQRVVQEFSNLVYQYGLDKDDLQTELLAIRNVFGPVESVQSKGERDLETHQETDTSGGGSEGKGNESGVPKGLSKREKAYYQSQIDKGRYKDWKEVGDELKFADNELRSRKAALHG